MSVYLVDTVFGMFILDANGEVLDELIVYPDVDLATSHRMDINEERIAETMKHVVETLSRLQPKEVVVEDTRLARILSVMSIPTRVDESSKTIFWFRGMLRDYLVNHGKIESEAALFAFLREVALRLARLVISIESGRMDLLIKQAIDAIDEIDKCVNLVTMRTREWYSMYYPSLSRLIEEHSLFVELVKQGYTKTTLTQEVLVERGLSQSTANTIMNALANDVGAALQDRDLEPIRAIATAVQHLYEARNELERYVEVTMGTTAPNITALVGPIVGARLISLAGSLMDLARLPSSTVQVLGAERALFRSFKTGTGPPKHGVIFQVPEIYTAPYWQRGKIARALAGKLSLAAKIDVFTARNSGDVIKAGFQRRVEEIRRQNQQPPPQTPRGAAHTRRSQGTKGKQEHAKEDRRRNRRK